MTVRCAICYGQIRMVSFNYVLCSVVMFWFVDIRCSRARDCAYTSRVLLVCMLDHVLRLR